MTRAPILYVRGRQHTVKIYNSLSMPEDYQEAAVRTFFQIHLDQPAGDVLIFLTGQDDIDSVSQQIKNLAAQLRPNQLGVRSSHLLPGSVRLSSLTICRFALCR